MVDFVCMQICSSYPNEIFDPHGYAEDEYLDGVMMKQQELEQQANENMKGWQRKRKQDSSWDS